MKILQKLFAATAVMAMLTSSVQGQDADYGCCYEESPAYCDSDCASRMCVWLPIGALIVAGVIIATTSRHHHHSRSSCSTTCCPVTHAHSCDCCCDCNCCF